MATPFASEHRMKVPPFGYEKVLRNAKSLLEEHKLKDVETVEQAVSAVQQFLKNNTLVVQRAVIQSIDDEDLASIYAKRQTAYRLAANRAVLLDGKGAPRVPSIFAKSVYVRVESIASEKDNEITFETTVLSGPLAGWSAPLSIPIKAMPFYFRIAHSDHKVSRELLSPKEFIRLRLAVRMHWDGIRVEFDRIGLTASAAKFNVDRTKSRRRDQSDCPYEYEIDCHACNIPWVECERSVAPAIRSRNVRTKRLR